MLTELVPCGNPEVIKTIDHPNRYISKEWLQSIKRDGKRFCAWCNVKELPRGRVKYCSNACQDSSGAYCYPQSSEDAFRILMTRQEMKCAHCEHDYTPAFQSLHRQRIQWNRNNILRYINEIKETAPEMRRRYRELKKSGKPNVEFCGRNEQGNFVYKSRLLEPQEISRWVKDRKQWIKDRLEERKELLVKGPKWEFGSSDYIKKFHRDLKDHKEPEIDHIIPVALGGMAIGLDNVQILCYRCHKIKTKKDVAEIRASRRGVS